MEFGSKVKGSTIPRRGTGFDKLRSSPDGKTLTLYENFLHGAVASNNGPCLGTRPIDKDGKPGDFQWQTYKKVIERYTNLGSGLINLGMKKGSRIGIYSQNRAEWQITAQACNAYSFVSVSIYDTLGEEHRQYIVDQAEIETIFTKKEHFNNVLDLKPECENLKHIVIFEGLTDDHRKAAEEAGLGCYLFSEVEDLGANNPAEVDPPKPDDLAIIMYTSGTTSRPKGVLITHKNVVSVIAGVTHSLLPIDNGSRFLSYLPLAHILERAAEAYVIFHGGRIGFFQGSMRKFPEDVQALKPTLFAGVPKVYQRAMNKIRAEVKKKGIVARIVFNLAYSIKRASIEFGFDASIIDRTIFKKPKEGLGGEVLQMLTGGAPCSAECQEFIRVVFGCPLMQGYGLTETCGGSVVTNPRMIRAYDKVGSPCCCCEIKLVDTGKYSTDTTPPQGEVCISGPSVARGYYKNPEKTATDFREENGQIWFHTGDVGQWNLDDGTLSIIGRVKDIFKLDSGEYISPARLETIYGACGLVGCIFIYGETTRSHLIAVVVPDSIAAKKWALQNGVDVPDAEETNDPDCPPSLCENEQFKITMLRELLETAKQSKLMRYEQIKNVYLTDKFWVPTDGLVTDAFKNKRPILSEHFGKQLARIYDEEVAF